MPFYREVTDENGEVRYEPVAVAEIPADELNEHPAVAELREARSRANRESAERRHRIRQLEEQLQALAGEGDEGREEPGESPDDPPRQNTSLDVQALAADVARSVREQLLAEETARAELAQHVDALVRTHGLPNTEAVRKALASVADKTARDAVASSFAEAGFRFDAPTTGGNGQGNRLPDVFTRVDKSLFPGE